MYLAKPVVYLANGRVFEFFSLVKICLVYLAIFVVYLAKPLKYSHLKACLKCLPGHCCVESVQRIEQKLKLLHVLDDIQGQCAFCLVWNREVLQ